VAHANCGTIEERYERFAQVRAKRDIATVLRHLIGRERLALHAVARDAAPPHGAAGRFGSGERVGIGLIPAAMLCRA